MAPVISSNEESCAFLDWIIHEEMSRVCGLDSRLRGNDGVEIQPSGRGDLAPTIVGQSFWRGSDGET